MMNEWNSIKSYVYKLGIVAMGVAGFSIILLSRVSIAQERLPGVVDRPAIEVPSEVKEPQEVEPQKEPELEKPEEMEQLAATLKEVKFSGDTILKEKVLQAVVAPYLNKPLTREDIAHLKYDIAKRYYDEGYVLVKVTTPPQDLSDGVLEVVVYAGRVGNIDIQINGKAMKPKLARAITSRIMKGEVFNEGTVESAIKDIDDITNVRAKLYLRPGTEFGTTDLMLLVEPVDEDVQQLMVDNYGSELTGKIVGTLDLKKSNLIGIGENMGLTVRQSENALTSVMVDYKMPVGLRNLKVELNYLYSENGIGDYLAALSAEGRTQRVRGSVSMMLKNTRQHQIAWRAGVESRIHKSFLSDIPETRDDISQAYLEGSILRRYPRAVFYGDLRLSKGVRLFGSDKEGEADASRLTGDPEAWRLQPTLYANLYLTGKDSLQTLLVGQVASKTLLASDLFVLGGYGSVRGFQLAKETGESGVQFSLEYSHQFVPREGLSIKVGPFLDGGQVFNRVPGSAVDSQLYSAGLGAEVEAGIFKFGESKLRLDWGHPIGNYESTRVDDDTVYFRVTQNF